MTLGKLRSGDVLAGLGGLGLLVVMFFPWYEFLEGVYSGGRTITPDNTEQNAWQAFGPLIVLLVLIALLGIGQFVTTAFERTSALPVAAQVFGGFLGTFATLWVLVRLINPPGPNFGADLLWGAWVGLLCVLAVTVGAWWSMRDELRP